MLYNCCGTFALHLNQPCQTKSLGSAVLSSLFELVLFNYEISCFLLFAQKRLLLSMCEASILLIIELEPKIHNSLISCCVIDQYSGAKLDFLYLEIWSVNQSLYVQVSRSGSRTQSALLTFCCCGKTPYASIRPCFLLIPFL